MDYSHLTHEVEREMPAKNIRLLKILRAFGTCRAGSLIDTSLKRHICCFEAGDFYNIFSMDYSKFVYRRDNWYSFFDNSEEIIVEKER